MTDRRLYTVSIPEHAQTRGDQSNSRNISDLAAVAGGSGSVTSLGTDAQQRQLRVQYKGYNDDLLARMLAELAASDDIEAVPYFGIDPDGNHVPTGQDGYYTVEKVDHTTPDDRTTDFPTVELNVKRRGTKMTHWRMLTAKPAVVENHWGNGQSQEFGIPSAASTVKWYDRDSRTQDATRIRSRSTKYGSVDLFTAADCPYTDIALLYEMPYPEEGKTDLAVWDTRGHDSKTDTLKGQTVLEWQRVFSTDHEFEGRPVISNGTRRLTIDTSSIMSPVEWEEWRTTAEGYGLNYGENYGISNTTAEWYEPGLFTPGEWSVVDYDFNKIDYSRVTGRLTWQSSNDGSTFIIAFSFARGATGIVFYEPENLVGTQGSVPEEVQEILDPVSLDTTFVMAENQTVQKRDEVHG